MTTEAPLYIDPEMLPILERMRLRMANAPAFESVPFDQMRARASSLFAVFNEDPPPLRSVRDLAIPGPGGDLPARLYDPTDGKEPAPLLLYMHGGGWVIGDLDLEDRAIRLLALASGARIISLDYRLAPEHPFPVPIDDVVAAFRWLVANATTFGGTADKIAVGGASAGANLAMAGALRLRDEGGQAPCLLVLLYGVFGVDQTTASYREFARPELFTPAMEAFFQIYAGDEAKRQHPLVAPLLADLSGLPPAFVNAAGLDTLRDDSRALAARLAEVGVPVEFKEYPGVLHGFTQYSRVSQVARDAIDDAGRALAAVIRPPRPPSAPVSLDVPTPQTEPSA
jgi:acetyl esterase